MPTPLVERIYHPDLQRQVRALLLLLARPGAERAEAPEKEKAPCGEHGAGAEGASHGCDMANYSEG